MIDCFSPFLICIFSEFEYLPYGYYEELPSGWVFESGIYRKKAGKACKEEMSVSDDCRSLMKYLEKFDLPGQCLRDERGLEEAGFDVLKSMSRENVCYAEIRFAPLFSETASMSCTKAIEALLKGMEKGKQTFGIEYGLITCAMRHHSIEMCPISNLQTKAVPVPI